MSHLWKDFHPASGETHADAPRGKELSVYRVWEGFSLLRGVEAPHEVSHRRAALHVQTLWERFHSKVPADSSYAPAYRRESLQVFSVSEILSHFESTEKTREDPLEQKVFPVFEVR